MVGTGRFELPTPRTPSECSTRLSHVPTMNWGNYNDTTACAASDNYGNLKQITDVSQTVQKIWC
jgi:hypothetical protein